MSLFIDIKKTFPEFALSTKLDCEDEVTALLGGSGCGKSLTLKCIAGIETPDEGRIVINGETVFDSGKRINVPPQKRHVGYLFQNYALFPMMTVWNNISSGVNKPRREKADVVAKMIEMFHLEEIENLYPRQISGGQQQRVALARMLVSEPKILLLDEPLSALDTHLKWKVEQELTAILAKFEGSTVFVSHDRSEAYRISDKIAVMSRGRVETVGTKEEVFGFPKTLAAAAITGCKNISRAEKTGEFEVRAVDWGVVLKTDESISDSVKYIGVRAHYFKQVSDLGSGENRFKCNVQKVIEDPFEKIVEFTFAEGKEETRLHFMFSKDKVLDGMEREFLIEIPASKIMCMDE